MHTSGLAICLPTQTLLVEAMQTKRTDVNFNKWIDEVLDSNSRTLESLTQNDWVFLKNRYKEHKRSYTVNL